MSKTTINRVAEEAGVSVSTVDRVLNERPGVRQQTIDRVIGAIDRLNYQPDRMAARLARARDYRLAFVVPTGASAFVAGLGHHIHEAARRGRAEHQIVQMIETDAFDAAALSARLDSLGDDYDGIAVVALDHPLVRESIDGLRARGVHVVTLVSDLPSSQRERYVGIDNAAAGRTAASMLGRFVGPRSGAVGVIAGSMALRDHIERRFGLEQTLKTDFPTLEILPVEESLDRADNVRAIAGRWLAERSDLVAIYNIGAGNSGLVDALRSAQRDGLVSIVHDLTTTTRGGLTSGHLDAVVNQDFGHEVRSAVRILVSLIDGEEIWDDRERIRIDIFLRDNLP